MFSFGPGFYHGLHGWHGYKISQFRAVRGGMKSCGNRRWAVACPLASFFASGRAIWAWRRSRFTGKELVADQAVQEGPQISFRIRWTGDEGAYGEIEVSVDGLMLMRAVDYPLTVLADQLTEWSRRVDDESACASFIFVAPHHPEFTGTFRIEPRPTNWQFASMWELRRHERLLPLDNFKELATRFHDQLNVA